MDHLTPDELLADAIGCVALNVLQQLADDVDTRRSFLEGFLALVEKLDIRLLDEVKR